MKYVLFSIRVLNDIGKNYMGKILRKFEDGTFLEYDAGKFDNWCVYYTNKNGIRKPPKDIDYFMLLKKISIKYGVEKVYNDFINIYNNTSKEVDSSIFQKIYELSLSYIEDHLIIEKILSILYLAMIAEEKKENTRLGKRIKRIGIYMLLIEDMDVYKAANFMKGMTWKEIANMCTKFGF